MKMHYSFYDSPIGYLVIITEEGNLTGLIIATDKTYTNDGAEYIESPDTNPLHQLIHSQLKDYFQGSRKTFDLPLKPEGTAFQKSVWAVALEIPYGETITYGEMAARLGDINKSRAVGGALGKNPIPIIIPCHRILGKNGKLTGFSAIGGVDTKSKLLEIEKLI